jgi:hypothetical protein
MNSPRLTTPNNRVAAARRIADKKRDAFNQLLSKLGAEHVAKMRHDALVAANKQLLGSGASAEQVVRQAQINFEAQVRFLVGERAA